MMPNSSTSIVKATDTEVWGNSWLTRSRIVCRIRERGTSSFATGQNNVEHTLSRNKEAGWLGIKWPGLEITPLYHSQTLATHFRHEGRVYFPFGPPTEERKLINVPDNTSPFMALAKLSGRLLSNILLQSAPKPSPKNVSVRDTEAIMRLVADKTITGTPALVPFHRACTSANELHILFEVLAEDRGWLQPSERGCIVRHNNQYYNLELLANVGSRGVDYSKLPLLIDYNGADLLYYHQGLAPPIRQLSGSKPLHPANALWPVYQEMAKRIEATHVVENKDRLTHLLRGDLGSPHPNQIFWPGLGWQTLREDTHRHTHFDIRGICYFPLDFATQKKLMHLPLQAGLFVAVLHIFGKTLEDCWKFDNMLVPEKKEWDKFKGWTNQVQPISDACAKEVLQAAANRWQPQQLRLHDHTFASAQLKSRADYRAREWHDKHLGCLIVEREGSYFVLEKHSQDWELVDYTFVPARLYPLDGSSNYYAFSFDVLP